MKKSALLLGVLAVMPAFAGQGNHYRYTTSCTDCGYETVRPVKTQTYKMASGRKSGYKNIITNNFYYAQPNVMYPNYYTGNRVVEKEAPSYDAYEYEEYPSAERTYTKKSYSSKMRKYFLAHPFFQPLKGRFGSVTDFSYAQNNFKFDILNASVLDIDKNSDTVGQVVVSGPVALDGKQETTQFLVKEDFSYGLADDLSLVGMFQYDKTKVAFKDWSSGEAADSVSDSGINIFGIGLQHRFVDNPEWIAMVSGFFQHQKDTANTLIGEIKGGYKIDRTTVYGLGRLGLSNLTDGDAYGAFVKSSSGDWLMLSYNTDVSNIVYAEIGAGVFSVLNKYVTLNGELIYGTYDWHNQLNLKGAIGFQPGDNFALNLYASTSLYDSAKDKTLKYMNYDVNPDTTNFPTSAQLTNLVYTTGDYQINNYKEWKIGVQAILYF